MATYSFIPYPPDDEWALLDGYQPTVRDFDNNPFILIGHLNDSTPQPGTPVYANARAQIRMSSKRGPILEYPAKMVDDTGRPFCIVDIPHYCPDGADTTSIPKANLFSSLDTDIPRKFFNPNRLVATTTLWSAIAGLLDANENGVRFSLRCELQNKYPPPPGSGSRKPSALPAQRKPSLAESAPPPSPLSIPSAIEEAPSEMPSSPRTAPESMSDAGTELEPEQDPDSEPEPVTICQCGNPLPPRKFMIAPIPSSSSRNPSMAQIAELTRNASLAAPSPSRNGSAARSPSASRNPSVASMPAPSRRSTMATESRQSRQPSVASGRKSSRHNSTSTASPARQPSIAPEPTSSRHPSVTPGPSTSRQPSFAPDPVPSRQPTFAPDPIPSRQPSFVPDPALSRQPSIAPGPSASRQPSIAPAPAASRQASVAPISRKATIVSPTPERTPSVTTSRPPLSPPMSPGELASIPERQPTFNDTRQDTSSAPPSTRKKVPGHGPNPASAPSISTESDISDATEVGPAPNPPPAPPLPPATAPPATAPPAAPLHPRVSIAPQVRLSSGGPSLVGDQAAPSSAPGAPLTDPAFSSPSRIGRVPTILSKLASEPTPFVLNPVPNRRDSATPAKKLPRIDNAQNSNPNSSSSPLEDLRAALKARRLSHRQRNVNDETLTIMTEALAALEQSTKSALEVNDRIGGEEEAMGVQQKIRDELERLKRRFGEDLVGALKGLEDGDEGKRW